MTALLVFFGWACALDSMELSSEVIVGSKADTEPVLLGEFVTLIARDLGYRATHREALGGTQIPFQGLLSGEVHVIPEYTGTLEEILSLGKRRSLEELRVAIRRYGLEMGPPVGFNSTYALGMLEETAAQLGVETISDLRRFPQLRCGFSREFLDREDGWKGLRKHYSLPQTQCRGLHHSLSYESLEKKSIDIMDVYTTDGRLSVSPIRLLRDDQGFFPEYLAVYVWRQDLRNRAPLLVKRLQSFENEIDAATMIRLNGLPHTKGLSEKEVARRYARKTWLLDPKKITQSMQTRLASRALEHLHVVLLSLSFAICVAVPLGIVAWWLPRLGQFVLTIVGIVQTVPSLVFFVLAIPLLGIGSKPVVAALFLYSLLPIVRGTYVGLWSIPKQLNEAATALGLGPWAQTWRVALPMASPSILSGIKTSAVINVGTATLGALIGAGGFGQPILNGIRLNDMGLVFSGAVPAAMMALATQGAFDVAERYLVPKGLRIRPNA